MRTIVRLGIAGLVAAVAASIGACATTRAFGHADDLAVRGVLADQRDAWNRGDLAGYMTGYAHSPDLVFTSGGQIRRGFDETFARYRAKYVDAKTMGHLELDVVSVQPLGADGAIVLGTWALTNTPVAAAGVFSVALERGADGWRVVHDHTSVATP